MPAFEPRSDPRSTSARWTRWLERFNTYLVAADIKDDEGKRTLLLYQARPEVYEIFKMLEESASRLRVVLLDYQKNLYKTLHICTLANMLIDRRKYETS